MSRWITNANIFAAAIEGKPMRVPLMAQVHDHGMLLAGISAKRFYSDPITLTEIELLCTEYYDFDIPFVLWDNYNLEAEAIGQKLKYPENSMPDIDQTHPLVITEKDLDKVKLERPEKAGRIPQLLEGYKLHLKYTGLPPVPHLTGPFSVACGIRSYTGN